MKNNKLKLYALFLAIALICFSTFFFKNFLSSPKTLERGKISEVAIEPTVLHQADVEKKDPLPIGKENTSKRDLPAFAKHVLEVGTDAYVNEGVTRLLDDSFGFRQTHGLYKGLPKAQLNKITEGLTELKADVLEKEKTLYEVAEVEGGSVIRIPANEELQSMVESRLRQIAITALGSEKGELLGELLALDPAAAWLGNTTREVSTVFRATDPNGGEEVPFVEIRYFNNQTGTEKRSEEFALLPLRLARLDPSWERYNHLANFEAVGESL